VKKRWYGLFIGDKLVSGTLQRITKGQAGERNAQLARAGLTMTRWKEGGKRE